MPLPPSLGFAGKGDDTSAAGRPLRGVSGLGSDSCHGCYEVQRCSCRNGIDCSAPASSVQPNAPYWIEKAA